MTILCAGNCHVWLGSSSLCTCEAHRVAMYGLNLPYNPFGPRAPKPDPPAETSLQQLRAAERVGAGWLSADGLTAYTMRYGKVLQADWDGANFGAWLEIGEELPNNVVRMQ